MHHFDYRAGVMHAEGLPLTTIAERVGTPFYCYSTATLERHYRVFKESFSMDDMLVAYSLKANSNLSIVRTLSNLGAGADIVSEGELRRALAAGIAPDKIVFSGVGKTQTEMSFALDTGIYQFNVESEPELELLSGIAEQKGQVAPIALRVNPSIDAGTHEKIATGRSEDKFGIPWNRARNVFDHARNLPGVKVVGIDVHIGSQITDLGPFEAAFSKTADLVRSLRAAGHDITRLDLGGGLGIAYAREDEAPPHPNQYAEMIGRVTKGLDVQLIFEPGRVIVGNAGILVARIVYIKQGDTRRFVILDAAMNDLIRPALYDAHHDILPVIEPAPSAAFSLFDVVGPVCETGDTLARDCELPSLESGDLVAVMSAGAYGAVQASEYNSRPLIAEVLVRGQDMAVIRERRTYEDMLAADRIADWLE
ncbi:MAG: diaminopimelate decarboxylase [Alphaproteobacteria bacterium]|nr:MAG: diaminopimelate decarboxylase [Alphaproteobacteria bacterium]